MPQTAAQKAYNERRSAKERAKFDKGIATPQWQPVQPAAPVTVKVPKRKAPAQGGEWKTALILPDTQFGYRWVNGVLDPFHDEAALGVAIEVAEAERPELTIQVGDYLDFPMFGTYRKEPAFANTTQATVDAAHQFAATIRELTGELRIMEGNHDLRLQNYLLDNAAEAYGLHPAGLPDSWPLLSVPALLRLDELGVEYVDGYPAGATFILDNLVVIHGTKVGGAGQTTAKAVLGSARISTIFGHVHRAETAYQSFPTGKGARTIMAHSPGCLCRIDGAVPGAMSGTKRGAYDRPAKVYPDWQQGVTLVRYNERTTRFAIEPILIFGGQAVHRGQVFGG